MQLDQGSAEAYRGRVGPPLSLTFQRSAPHVLPPSGINSASPAHVCLAELGGQNSVPLRAACSSTPEECGEASCERGQSGQESEFQHDGVIGPLVRFDERSCEEFRWRRWRGGGYVGGRGGHGGCKGSGGSAQSPAGGAVARPGGGAGRPVGSARHLALVLDWALGSARTVVLRRGEAVEFVRLTREDDALREIAPRSSRHNPIRGAGAATSGTSARQGWPRTRERRMAIRAEA